MATGRQLYAPAVLPTGKNPLYIYIYIQGAHKRFVRFQKLTRNLSLNLTRVQPTPSAAATVHVSHALPAVRFSCLLRGCGASFLDGVAEGKGFLCAPF